MATIICRDCGEEVRVIDGLIACCFNKDCGNYMKYATIGTQYFSLNYMEEEL